MLSSQSDHLSAHLGMHRAYPMQALQSAYCHGSQITFQLTSWLAANTQTADKPSRSPFCSPCSCAALNTRIAAGQKRIPTPAQQSSCQASRINLCGRGRDLVSSGKEGTAVGNEARGRYNDLGGSWGGGRAGERRVESGGEGGEWRGGEEMGGEGVRREIDRHTDGER
jgi:hypothetical protein